MKIVLILALSLLTVKQARPNLLDLPGNNETTTNIWNPQVLGSLEKIFPFSYHLNFSDEEKSSAYFPDYTNNILVKDQKYLSLVQVFSQDLIYQKEMVEGFVDHSSNFIIKKVVNNSADAYEVESNGDAPRQFDKDWFSSKFGYYKLKGIINRIDRRDFDYSEEKTCGEIRFIYRLAYDIRQDSGSRYFSSLPFFFNVVYTIKDDGENCQSVAKSWITSEDFKNQHSHYTNWVKNNLTEDKISFKQIESNFQSLRFSGGYKRDIGGQAMYMMRIFKLNQENLFEPIPLENTPDLKKLMDPENNDLKQELKSYITENIQQIDQGIYQIPQKFLAKLAISYSTIGRARLANKPFDRLFNGEEFDHLNYENSKFINSGRGVIERLNNNTCMGCHQSGGMAGFHAFGLPSKEVNDPFSSLELPFSSHLYADTIRRDYYVKTLSQGIEPNKLRPHSFYPPAKWTQKEVEFEKRKDKEVCLPHTKDFKAPLTCDSNFNGKTVCSTVVTNEQLSMEFQECVNYRSGNIARVSSGVACVRGNIDSSYSQANNHQYIGQKNYSELKDLLTYNFYDFTDRFTAPLKSSGKSKTLYEAISKNHNSQRYSCRPPSIGVPLGRRYRSCSKNERSMLIYDEFNSPDKNLKYNVQNLLEKNHYPQEICATVGGSAFERCAMGNDVLGCLKEKITRGVLDTCYPGRFCREDYICQKLPLEILKKDGQTDEDFFKTTSGKAMKALYDKNIGYCNPSYFFFNMRSDGHPYPTGDGKVKDLKNIVKSREVRGGYSRHYGK